MQRIKGKRELQQQSRILWVGKQEDMAGHAARCALHENMYRPQIGRQTHAFDLCQATVKEEGRMWTVLGWQQEKLRLQGQHEEEGKKDADGDLDANKSEALLWKAFLKKKRFVTLNYYL